jgi:hypothetical protein
MANTIIDTLLNPKTVIREREQNNILDTRNGLLRTAEAIFGNLPDGTIGAAGNVNGANNIGLNDATDVFSFTVDRPARLDTKLLSNNESGISFNLVKDFDNNGKKDFGANFEDLLDASFQPGADQISFDRLDPGTYFLEINKTAVPDNSIDYTLIPKASVIASSKLNIEIERLIPLGTRGNVVVRAEIDGRFRETQPFAPIANQGIFLSAPVDPNKREVTVKLDAFKLSANGTRSPLDLNFKSGTTQLSFTYDTLTREVIALAIRVAGEKRRNRAL